MTSCRSRKGGGGKGHARDTLIGVFDKLGIPLNPKKIEGPATCLEFLGITLDTVEMEARLSAEKIEDLKCKLLLFQDKKKCTQKELLSLIGSLSFACKVVIPGRSFLSRLIARAYSVRELHHNVRFNSRMRKECKIWLRFIDRWNGKSLFISGKNLVDDEVFFTDAAGAVGYGGFFQGKWFSVAWTTEQLAWDIVAKELYPIVVAAQVWGGSWSGRRVVVKCDNSSTVAALNKSYSNKVLISDMLRVLMFFSLTGNFHMRAIHIPGKYNNISDALSRLQVDRFRNLVPTASETPCSVLQNPLDLCEELFMT